MKCSVGWLSLSLPSPREPCRCARSYRLGRWTVHSVKQLRLTQRTREPEGPHALLWFSGPLGEPFFFFRMHDRSMDWVSLSGHTTKPPEARSPPGAPSVDRDQRA